MIQLNGFGPVAGVLSATMYSSTTPPGFAEAALARVDASSAEFITGSALPHLAQAHWPMPTTLRAFVCLPERRPSRQERQRLMQSPVHSAAAQRDVSRFAMLLHAVSVGSLAALKATRLESGRDEMLGRLCPGFFPARMAAWEAGALVVSFGDDDGEIVVFAEDDSTVLDAARSMKTVFDVHSQTTTWAFLAGADS